MRHIVKLSEPSDFSNWKNKYPGARYKDLRDEQSFPGADNARKALRNSLLTEQKGICCYCERNIESGDFHVEHFRPKGTGLFPHLQLDYYNLHASCKATPSGDADEHCGHKKSNIFSSDLISPLERDCATHFVYDCNGGIDSIGTRGKKTIGILNLNSALLRKSRRCLIEYFEELEETEFEKAILEHLDATTYPIAEFYSTIEYLYTNKLLLPDL